MQLCSETPDVKLGFALPQQIRTVDRVWLRSKRSSDATTDRLPLANKSLVSVSGTLSLDIPVVLSQCALVDLHCNIIARACHALWAVFRN